MPMHQDLGKAFTEWWNAQVSSTVGAHDETAARSAWDAAIFIAVTVLQQEVDRLVSAGEYVEAAATRDGRVLVEGLFSKPGQWDELRHWRDKMGISDPG